MIVLANLSWNKDESDLDEAWMTNFHMDVEYMHPEYMYTSK